MENLKALKQNSSHTINVDSRRRVDITGVTEVVTFNEEAVILNTVMGGLNIKGKGMKVHKLNVENGDMSIEGEIDSLVYTNKDHGHRESFLKKMFK